MCVMWGVGVQVG